MAYFFLILAFSLNSVANIALKIKAKQGISLDGSLITIIQKNYLLFGALSIFALNIIFYFLALRTLPLAFAYPIMTVMSFLLINGYAYFALHESISTMQLLGYALVVVGISFVCIFGSRA